MPKKLQPFANQKSGQASQSLDNFHNALEHYSGGDPIALLKRYFFSYKKGKKTPFRTRTYNKRQVEFNCKINSKKARSFKKNMKKLLYYQLYRENSREQNYRTTALK
jgi:hypothetical protein